MKSASFPGKWILLLAAMVVASRRGQAADITWNNPAGGDWNIATNWNPSQVPGPSDKATLASGVAVTVDADTTVSNLDLSAGTLAGSGVLTVSGTMNWTGGTMNGTGATTIGSGGSLSISGNNDKSFSQRTINNSGTITWSGGNVSSGFGATLNNLAGGVFDLQSDQSWAHNFGGNPPVVNNTGTIKKSAGSGTSTLQVSVNNNGSLDVQSGTLNLTKSGDSHGSFNAGAGATLSFGAEGMTLETNSTVTAAGTVSFTGATVDINGSYNVSNTAISGGSANFNSNASTVNATLSGGTLAGSGVLTVSGTMNWTGGTMNGTGATTIGSGGSLSISGNNDKSFSQRTINNSGTITWSGGNVSSGFGATLNNLAGGVFDLQSDQSWAHNFGGNPPVVNNTGTIKKSAGSGTSTLQVSVNNNGSLDVQSGTLNLTKSGDSHGSFNAGAGATLSFGAEGMTLETNSTVTAAGTVSFTGATVDINGSYNVSNTAISGGSANFNSNASTVNATLSGGTLAGSGVLTVSGTMNWTGGTMNGTGATTIGSGGSLSISGNNDKSFSQRTINNSGTITWSGGNVSSGFGATLNNLAGGVFDLQSDQSWAHNFGGNPPVVNNTGTIKKSAGSGTSTLQVSVNNNGSLDVQSGTLNLTKSGDSHGSFNAGAGATLSFGAEGMTLETNSTVTAAGTVSFTGATVDINGSYNVSNTAISGGSANFNSNASTVNATLSGGTLAGSGVLTVSGTMNWTGGTMNGTGATTIGSGGSLSISGNNDKSFSQRTINNSGTITWSGGNVSSGFGATLNNLAGGVFDLQSDQSWAHNFGGNPPVVNNTGTIKKSAGSGTSTLQVSVNNNGSLDVQSGTLNLTKSGDSHGSFNAGAGATLSFGAEGMTLETNSTVTAAGTVSFTGATVDINGSYNVSNTAISGGSANFNSNASTVNATLSGGTLAGSGVLTVSGTMNWTGGTMNGTGATTIGSGGSLSISGNNDKSFSQRTINNSGTITWSGGNVSSGFGATLNNLAGGVFDLQSDQSWAHNFGGNPPVVNNTGTIKKSAGSGTSTLQVSVNNNGSLDVQSGTLNLTGPSFTDSTNGSLQGTGTLDVSHTTFSTDGPVLPGDTLGALYVTGNLPQTTNSAINIQIGGTNAGVNYDQLVVSGSAILKGALNIDLVNGFRPLAGDQFEVLKFGSGAGTFDSISGLDLGGSLYLQPVFTGTNVVLTTIDTRPRPVFDPLERLANGQIQFTLSNVAGQDIVVYANTNLTTIFWIPILTNLNSGAVFRFIESDTTNYQQRFFKTALLP